MRLWLDEKNIRKFQATYMSPPSQNEFIGMLADVAKKRIISEINQSGPLGVIADTTPDVSHCDQLTVAVRYVSKEGEPKERLIQTRQVSDKTGAGMAKEIVDTLSESNVEIDNLRFQTYDNTRF